MTVKEYIILNPDGSQNGRIHLPVGLSSDERRDWLREVGYPPGTTTVAQCERETQA